MSNLYPLYPSCSYILRLWSTLEEENLTIHKLHKLHKPREQQEQQEQQECSVAIISRPFVYAEKFLSIYVFLFGNTDYFISSSDYKEIGIMQAFEIKQQQQQQQLTEELTEELTVSNSNNIYENNPQFNLIFKCKSTLIAYPWSVTIPSSSSSSPCGSIHDVEIKIKASSKQLSSLLSVQHVVVVVILLIIVIIIPIVIMMIMSRSNRSKVLSLICNQMKMKNGKKRNKNVKFVDSNVSSNSDSISSSSSSSSSSRSSSSSSSFSSFSSSSKDDDDIDVWDLDQWLNYDCYRRSKHR